MSAKQLVFKDDARGRIVSGVAQLAHAVRGTLGPKARTVVLQRAFGAPSVINSGVVVAKEVELPDPLENMGAQMVREVAPRLPTWPATAPPRPRSSPTRWWSKA
jgi:chaperonin GroEL